MLINLLNMLKQLIGEDIDLAWFPGEDLWPARIDPGQVDQIMMNLCVNARDAIAGVGNIIIETRNTRFDAPYCADHPGIVPGEPPHRLPAGRAPDRACPDAETEHG